MEEKVNWIDEMIIRLNQIANSIKARVALGDNKIDIVKSIDNKFILEVFKNILNGSLKLNVTIELFESSKNIRNSQEYKIWRQKVFQRDSYICQFCYKKVGKLNADHIKPFAYFKELRFELSNGRTLCEPCHRTTDTHGRRYKLAI